MTFSIIIPTYNRRALIERTFRSILSQTYPSRLLEVIVVDDGNDGSEMLADEILSGKVAYLYCKNTERFGLSRSRNYGISQAKSEFVVLLDSDNYLVDDAITFFADAISKNQADVLFTSNIDTAGNSISFTGFEGTRVVNYSTYFRIKGEFLPICRREVLVNNRFEESFDGGEGLLWVQLVGKYRVAYSSFVSSVYNVATDDRLSTQKYDAKRALRMKTIYYYDLAHNSQIYGRHKRSRLLLSLAKLVYYNYLYFVQAKLKAGKKS